MQKGNQSVDDRVASARDTWNSNRNGTDEIHRKNFAFIRSTIGFS
jgi:hypothetical protein